MRILPYAAALTAGVAGLVLLLDAAPSTSANATHISASRVRSPRPNTLLTPTPCSTSNPTSSFIGITGYGNVAGGLHGAVLGGQSNQACDFDSTIAGGEFNGIGENGNAYWDFIGAGTNNSVYGEYGFDGSGTYNFSGGDYSFIGAGAVNEASGAGSFVGAGGFNFLVRNGNGNSGPANYGNIATGYDSFIGAGDLNETTANANGSFIGAGGYTYSNAGPSRTPGNVVDAVDSFIGAGDQNTVAAANAFLGGGNSNAISSSAVDGTLGGGSGNQVGGKYGTVAGGIDNYATGDAATVPGGYSNQATGSFSFAAGIGSRATTAGSFVWSDDASGASHLTTTAANQFLARSSGGFKLYTNAAATTGAYLAAGSGSWASASDRTLKHDVRPIDDAAILDKVAALPVAEWSYTSERGVRHLGPMAQDFYAAFGVGEDDRHITAIDEDGVALAAIKALHSENAGLRSRLAAEATGRARDVSSLQRQLAKLARDVARLESRATR